MLTMYRCLLRLYPAAYRTAYADEMISVFLQAHNAARESKSKIAARIVFCARETAGLLGGALREQARSILGPTNWIPFRRFDMRPQFRFPRSTVFLMTAILAGVLLTIEKAKGIQLKYGSPSEVSMWPGLPWAFATILLMVSVAVVIVWGILFALHRTGMHRLANLQTDLQNSDASGSNFQA
jgi:hypothetical protein